MKIQQTNLDNALSKVKYYESQIKEEETVLAHVLTITDAMREQVLAGQPLFAGAVKPAIGVPVENLKNIVEEVFLLYPGSPNVKIAPTEALADGCRQGAWTRRAAGLDRLVRR